MYNLVFIDIKIYKYLGLVRLTKYVYSYTVRYTNIYIVKMSRPNSKSTSRAQSPINNASLQNEIIKKELDSIKAQLNDSMADMASKVENVFKQERLLIREELSKLRNNIPPKESENEVSGQERVESEESSTESSEEERDSGDGRRKKKNRRKNTHRVHNVKSSNKEFLDALRFASVICKNSPTSSNIQSWLETYWSSLSQTFPNLRESEKCKICISRFPHDIGENLANAGVESKEVLFANAIALFSPGEHNIEASRSRFYSTCPQKGTSLIGFINQLSNLSLSLGLSCEARQYALIKRVINFFPAYFRAMAQTKVDTLSRLGEKLTVMEALSDIFSNPQAVSEIEKSWSMGPTSRVNQVRDEDKDQGWRCLRCGSKKHRSAQCPVYPKDSLGKICGICYDVSGYQHRHREEECVFSSASASKN